ncbi:hypothetical protein ACFW1A_25155 [Kitasatospora sp. NPDC058965]|uniref:hypothetical protein n=1 Tax=Kitasatospora sp. NPDC058965 TaxID=3346682 RepID=UPI003687BD14
MGSSYIRFHGEGFWASDSEVEIWLYFLCLEIDATQDQPNWLREVRDSWYTHATVGFTGCVDPYLDRHIGADEDHREILLALADRARERVRGYSPSIPRDVANSWQTGADGSEFTRDLEVQPLLDVADKFIGLLRLQGLRR